MSRVFRSIAIFLSTIIFVTILVDPDKVSANDHDAASYASPPTAQVPPLPSFTPEIGPSLTFGYHQAHSVPTKTEKWIDVDLSEQRVVAYAQRGMGAVLLRGLCVSWHLLAQQFWPTDEPRLRQYDQRGCQVAF
jgi:hypothetical protein